MEEELINKKDIKKKKNILTLSILSTIVILLGSAYAFFTYFKSAEAFTLTSNQITASFTEGTNQISFTNAYPISDEFALENLSKLDYIDFTVSGNATNPKEAITYEIFLTEANGNTLSNNFVKLYLTDGNNNEVVSPNIYGNLGTTTYTSEPTGKVILTKTLSGKFSKSYRLYCWLDSTFEDNTISRTFSFYVNLYAYNNTSNNASQEITINTIEDLVNLSNSVNNGTTYQGVTVNLERSLDFEDTNSYEDSTRTDYGDINGNGIVETLINELTNTCDTCGGFIPIGKYRTNSFRGTFNGNGYQINNLYENNINNGGYLGLFGSAMGSSINNLTIDGNIIYSNNTKAGGILGRADGVVNLNNCHTKVNIQGISSGDIGGILGVLGSSSNVTIRNSSNSGNISAGNITGGIVGNNYSSGNNSAVITIENSFNTGEINSSGTYIGGIIGNTVERNSTIIKSSYNIGNVVNSQKNPTDEIIVGGLAGRSFGNIQIKDSYNGASVSSDAESSILGIIVSGVVGRIGGNAIVENSYNSGNITGGNRLAGIVGHSVGSNKIILNKVYNSGIVSSTVINSSSSYDILSGGIFGYPNNSNVTILNSCNYGDVYSEDVASGLLSNNLNSSIKIINSYNIGNIFSDNYIIAGISRISVDANDTTNSTTVINNVYNFGTLTATSTFGILYVASKLDLKGISLLNAYYLNNVANGTNRETSLESLTTSMSLNDMKSQTFVNTLNNNISNIDLSNIDSSLSGYTLSKWKLGTDGYPVFEWQN